ncbi:tripartite tricarboxylate transporter TctB family protein [Motiliproteus sp. MSK22-1]|uniref:tripartite tricarboxylate transporter TctB family protein n=1 Tax=Motiliproteus sp. MSK22-1 TaxID=1897630 RepID=UPI000977F562|nr:tripartite tricarboxylate transporter TctB family protein [Motiliproteus sp. MSK22-1]OMH32824.1 hypothetical protein BGP75_14990 [Motiliproteus sp. MSK22-1]
MILTKDHIGGLVFLGVSVVYGYHAGQIPLIPGDEFEPFNARSLPTILAWLCGLFSLALLASAKQDSNKRLRLLGYDFELVGKLLVLMVLFGLTLDWIGFLLSSMLFLIGGYWLLGERRIKTLLLASVPFVFIFWLVLVQLLDIYLAPGRLFS